MHVSYTSPPVCLSFISTDLFLICFSPRLSPPPSPSFLHPYDFLIVEVFQRTLKADLCHFNRYELTFAVSSVCKGHGAGHVPSVSYPQELMNASTLVCWKLCMFVYYVYDGSHRDQSGKDKFFDESMELKFLFLYVCVLWGWVQTNKLQMNSVFFLPSVFSLRVGLVYTGLLHHLRTLTERNGLCGKFGEYIILLSV